MVLALGCSRATGMECPAHLRKLLTKAEEPIKPHRYSRILRNPDRVSARPINEETSTKKISPEEEQGRKLIQAINDEDMDLIYASIEVTPSIINYQDPETGKTPLLEAAGGSNRQIIKLLLQKGADPSIKNAQGFPPVFIILKKRSNREELLTVLISYNIQARDARGPNGQTALQYAVEHDLPEKRVLLSLWANIDVQDDRGWTALHYAVDSGNSIAVDFLLAKGANPNIQSFVSDGNRTADMVINSTTIGRSAPDIVSAIQKGSIKLWKRMV